MAFVPRLQANKSVDSFFDLLVGRTSYNINGITVPLQARPPAQMPRCRVPSAGHKWACEPECSACVHHRA